MAIAQRWYYSIAKRTHNKQGKECYSVKLSGKTLYATAAEEFSKTASEGSELYEELRYTQEEAETRLLLHAYHAGRNGCTTVVISSDNTDLHVPCLEFQSLVPCSVHMKCGAQARTKYSGSLLIRTPRGHAKVSVLSGCPFLSGISDKRSRAHVL